MSYTARVENWVVEGGRVHGVVYDDRKQRFEDGTYIHTSPLLLIGRPTEGAIMETENSRYLLGRRAT